MMRKILVSQFLTLDGIMEAPEQWNPKYSEDAEVVQEILADLSASDLLLLGRTSYDFFASRWPSRTGAMADHFNNLPKLVVSTTLQKPEWNNTTILGSTIIQEVKKQKQLPGNNILVVGSHKLVQTLMQEKLIDEYKLYLYPLTLGNVTLGNGKRLFEHGAPEQTLKLITAKQFESGVVAMTYGSEK